MVEDDRFAFLTVDVNDFFALGDRGERLVDDLQPFERSRGGVQLSQTSVDQDQAGKLFLFFLQAFITTGDDLAHGGEVVHAIDAANDELAVLGFFHLPIVPHHHRGYGLGTLNVRNIKTLDAFRAVRETEHVLERFLYRLGVRLHNAEALVVGLLGVVAGEIDERTLVSAPRDKDVHTAAVRIGKLFREQVLERFTVVEIDRNVDVSGNVGLADVELSE